MADSSGVGWPVPVNGAELLAVPTVNVALDGPVKDGCFVDRQREGPRRRWPGAVVSLDRDRVLAAGSGGRCAGDLALAARLRREVHARWQVARRRQRRLRVTSGLLKHVRAAGSPTVYVAAEGPLMLGASRSLISTSLDPVPASFVALTVTVRTPPGPAVGVPVILAVPSPLSVNVTPVGRVPSNDSVGCGLPVEVKVVVPVSLLSVMSSELGRRRSGPSARPPPNRCHTLRPAAGSSRADPWRHQRTG